MSARAKTEVEWAFVARVDGEVRDVETFNRRTCHWDEPIEEWGKKIMENGWLFDHAKRKWGKTLRLVKRTTRIETIWRYGK